MKTISFDESVWKLVPVELTAEMRAAAKPCTTVSHLWASILSAAPAAPEQQAPNAQQAEPPPWWPAVENILNEYGLQAVDFVADFKAAQQAEAQEPCEYQFQDRNGKWRGFLDEQHKLNTIADGTWPIRPLFTRPQPAQLQALSEEEAITAWRGVKDVGDDKYNAILLGEAIQSALAAKNGVNLK